MEFNAKTTSQWTRALLKPVVKFCMRHSVQIQVLIEDLKHSLIFTAESELLHRGEKANVSRLSAMTGLHRRDVVRIYKKQESKHEAAGLVSRVIGKWLQDKRFCKAPGSPNCLPLTEGGGSFQALVSSISTDIHPGTVLFELERLGAIAHSNAGIKLVTRMYRPRADLGASLKLLSDDSADLAQAVEENILAGDQAAHPHAKTEYDNIDRAHLAEIQRWLVVENDRFHQRARKFLAKFDRDLNQQAKSKVGRAVRVALGSFAIVSDRSERD